MTEAIQVGLLWFAAIACGVMAGVYFAFSAFLIAAFDGIDRAAGAAAMNAINRVILRSAFMPLFLVSTLASLLLAVVALIGWGRDGSVEMLAGGILYLAGMFIVTMLFNVPLNNALMASPDSGDVWARFVKRWTAWNHVRTLASTGAFALFIAALVQVTKV